MDPITAALTVVLLGAGYVGGRLRRRRKSPPPPDYTCRCEHGFHVHDPKTGACMASVQQESKWTLSRAYVGPIATEYEYVPCPCQQYLGERPLDLPMDSIMREIADRSDQD